MMHKFPIIIHTNNGDNMEGKDPYFNQCIDCNVADCTYHNASDNRCTLAKILVGTKNNNKDKSATICESYEKRCN